MNKLKYANYYIGYQEVPNEVTLCINISGCPHHCEGCHSQYLWEYEGNYISDDIDALQDKYKGMITCICFMGGDQNLEELTELLLKSKYLYKLKTCVYSGTDNIQIFNDILLYLDYLKIGRFNINLGGLDKQTTNQKFYKVNNYKLEDITNIFIK
jgi:anaerobic ribonucleoside-triphosphate reductase activating protein